MGISGKIILFLVLVAYLYYNLSRTVNIEEFEPGNYPKHQTEPLLSDIYVAERDPLKRKTSKKDYEYINRNENNRGWDQPDNGKCQPMASCGLYKKI